MQERVDREVWTGEGIAAASSRKTAAQRSGLKLLELVMTHLSFVLFIAGAARLLGQRAARSTRHRGHRRSGPFLSFFIGYLRLVDVIIPAESIQKNRIISVMELYNEKLSHGEKKFC